MSVDIKELEEITGEAAETNGVPEPSAVSEAVDAATASTPEATEEPKKKGPARRYLTLEPREGYGLPVAGDAVYQHESVASVEGWKLRDFAAALQALAAKQFEGKIVVTIEQSKTKDGQALGRRIFIDTPASAEAAKKTGRAPKTATIKKVRTNADAKAILGKILELLMLDETADLAKAAGMDRRSYARVEACKALSFDLATLIERAEELGIKTQLGL